MPSIQKGNEGFVHHLILNECHGNFTKEHFHQGGDCNDRANMPTCRSYAQVAAWAVGGEVKTNSSGLLKDHFYTFKPSEAQSRSPVHRHVSLGSQLYKICKKKKRLTVFMDLFSFFFVRLLDANILCLTYFLFLPLL